MLSNKAVNVLANKVAPKAVQAIFESEKWVDLCQELIPDVVINELGDLDEDLLYELSLSVMDKIILKAV